MGPCLLLFAKKQVITTKYGSIQQQCNFVSEDVCSKFILLPISSLQVFVLPILTYVSAPEYYYVFTPLKLANLVNALFSVPLEYFFFEFSQYNYLLNSNKNRLASSTSQIVQNFCQ